MARPVKSRRVESLPEFTCFVSAGRRKCEIEEILIIKEVVFVMDNVLNIEWIINNFNGKLRKIKKTNDLFMAFDNN